MPKVHRNSTPRATPSAPRPSARCPRPGNSSDDVKAVRGSTEGRASLLSEQGGEGVPQTSQASSSIAFACSQAGQVHVAPCVPRRRPRPPRSPRGPRRRRRRAAAGVGRRIRGSSSVSEAKHWPHQSASADTRARQLGHRRSSTTLTVRAYPPRMARGTNRRRRTCSAHGLAQPARQALGDRAARRDRAPRGPGPAGAHGPGARPGPPGAPPPRRRPRPRRSPSTRTPVSPSTSGLARPARVAHHHRPAARRGLDEHVAPPLHLEAREPAPTRHREHVAGRVVAGQILLRHLTREHHRAGRGVGRPAPRALPGGVRRRRSAAWPPGTRRRIRSIPRINTSCPFRATRRLTHTTRGRSPTPWRSRRSSVGRSGRNASRSAPG